eukprot:superscaffoldBa00001462_g10666
MVAMLLGLLNLEQRHRWDATIESLVFLFWLASGASYKVVFRVFGIPCSTVYRIVHRVTEEVVAIHHMVIHLLKTQEDLEAVSRGFAGLARHRAFMKAAGGINGCHVHIKLLSGPDGQCYRNRKLCPLIILQAVCDHQGHFHDTYVDWPGWMVPMPPTPTPPHSLQEASTRWLSPALQRSNIDHAFRMMKTRFQAIFLQVITACTLLHNIGDGAGAIVALKDEPEEDVAEDEGENGLETVPDLNMMDMEQAAGSCPAPDQAAVSTWLSSSTKGATRTPSDVLYRFHGDGVRYKAKLIGVDPVPTAHGEKTCWDSMMKLKAVLHDHERSRISSLTKDQSDLRALAYIYQQEDTYTLFYIKMANLADPVMVDIKEVCERVDPETPEDATETQNSVLLVLDESSDHLPEANEHVFSPRPDSPSRQTKQPSSSNELMEIFSIQMEEPLMPSQSVCSSEPESPKQMLSNPQILSMFPTQPVGGSPYSSPPYSPTAMPWGQQGPLRTQRAGPMGAAPWPTMNGGMVAWAATGITALPTGSQIQAHSSQPGVMMRRNTIDYPTAPTAVNGYPTPLNSPYNPPGATATLQSMSPSMEHNPFL